MEMVATVDRLRWSGVAGVWLAAMGVSAGESGALLSDVDAEVGVRADRVEEPGDSDRDACFPSDPRVDIGRRLGCCARGEAARACEQRVEVGFVRERSTSSLFEPRPHPAQWIVDVSWSCRCALCRRSSAVRLPSQSQSPNRRFAALCGRTTVTRAGNALEQRSADTAVQDAQTRSRLDGCDRKKGSPLGSQTPNGGGKRRRIVTMKECVELVTACARRYKPDQHSESR